MGDYQPMPRDNIGDFSEVTFVAGGFTGRRAFRVCREDDEPVLLGPVYRHLWATDRINVATCQARTPLSLWQVVTGNRPGPHKVAGPECQCGFWSYFAENDWTRTYRNSVRNGFGIEGIIFGWGTCGVGPRGFRAAKARILALVRPEECEMPKLLDDAMEKYNIRWFDSMEDAVERWPLSAAKQYKFVTPPEPEVA